MADYRKVAEGTVRALRFSQPLVIDEIYHVLRKEHILMDALAYITDDYEYKKLLVDYTDAQTELADAIAERLVYEGDYDRNLSYWENIKNLYDEITSSDTEPALLSPMP